MNYKSIVWLGVALAILPGCGPVSDATNASPQASAKTPSANHDRKPEKNPEPRKPTPDEYGNAAYVLGKKAIMDRLKAPSSAVFSPLSDEHTGWEPYGYNQWKAFGYVDAQNSFGASLRQHWRAVVRKSGDDLVVIYLRLGDDETGPMPAVAAAPPAPATPEQIAAAQAATSKKKADALAAAVKFNQEQAASGDSGGQYRMGQRYLTGDGVEKDLSKARDMFVKAALQGHEGAQAELQKITNSK